jgi:oxalate decarboxylase/phosphoglucose isomerase-like protein (cupin superfamily)
MGVEYIRSHIYYSESKTKKVSVSEIIEVLHGETTILLQKNYPKDKLDFYTSVSEGFVVRLNENEKFSVPTGYYYTFINTEGEPAIFTRFYQKECKCNYNEFKKERGLAYFAIKKNAKQEIVTNPRYRNIPELKERPAEELDYCEKLGIDKTKPMYDQAVVKPEPSLSLI